MRAGPEPASANSLTHASTRPPPGTDLSPLQTVFSCSIQPLDPRNAKVALGATAEGWKRVHLLPLCAENSHRLARRAAMPISPQRRTLGDLAVRRTVRVDRR
jgi:hypothetical protein